MKLEEIRNNNGITELRKTQVYDFYKNARTRSTPRPIAFTHCHAAWISKL